MLTTITNPNTLRKSIPAAFAMAGLVPAAIGGPDQLPDRDIVDAIGDDLFYASVVDASKIDVTAKDGVVTLRGEVATLRAKQRSIKTAMSIRGVRSVVDRITVKSTDLDDPKIRSGVVRALADDPATQSYDVRVDMDKGIATLSGSVHSGAQKRLSEDVVASVHGVLGVKNNIEVDPPTNRSMDEIQRDVSRLLQTSVWVDSGLIKVGADGRDITLTGTVSSAAERLWAMRLAYVEGVKNVDASDLLVVPILPDDTQKWPQGPLAMSDTQILDAVTAAIDIDPRVSEFEVTVRASDGAVTLTGLTDNLAAKQAAEAAARNTVGVERVKNHIRVVPGVTTTDEQTATSLRAAMLRDSTLADQIIEVRVDDGVATLRGDVDTEYEKIKATEIASNIPGVLRVHNRLDYNYDWEWQPDRELRDDIQDQLFWSPYVDSSDLTVSVQDGVATIRGPVDDWSELSSVRTNAYEGGAKDVRLMLTYPSGDTVGMSDTMSDS